MLKDAEIKISVVVGAQFPVQKIDLWTRFEQFDKALKVAKVKETLILRVCLLLCYESFARGEMTIVLYLE